MVLDERCDDAKPKLKGAEPGPYDEQIEESCFYARKAQAYKNAYVALIGDLDDYNDEHENDAVSCEFAAAIHALRKLSEEYERISGELWAGFEKDAIRENDEEKPFYNLLGAIYKGMVEEYRSCVATILKPGESLERRDEACSRYIYLEEYFKGTGAEPILHREIEHPDLLERYVEAFKWRHKKR